MTRFRPSILPPHAEIYERILPGDFLDCYSCETDLDVQDAAARAMELPRWADCLMRLRNVLVVPFGIEAKNEQMPLSPADFPVTYQNETEIQLGLDDKHLNFRITIMRHQGQIYLSTWVHTHNLMGNIYLTIVMPFHKIIIRNRMAYLARS